MSNVIVVGTQWGDEGKGKVIDLLTPFIDVVVRFQGGANAGHTVVIGEQKTILHLVPSGILHAGCLCVIGNGVVVDPKVLIDEIGGLLERGYLKDPSRLIISQNAHLVLPYHRVIDQLSEEGLGEGRIGTTGRGIGPAYADKVARIGIRMGDLRDMGIFRRRMEVVLPVKNRQIEMLGGTPFDIEDLVTQATVWSKKLHRHITNTEQLIHEKMGQGNNILFEGAQGTALDVDHGTYPYVTSSNTVAGEACCGAGIGPTAINHVMGITKSYTTRVGNGPFPTELADEVGGHMQKRGKEFGATTGRKRRCGWLDLVVVRHAVRVNGITMLALTKLDVLTGLPKLRICTAYRIGDRLLDYFPASAEEFGGIEPVYEEMPGWDEDIADVRKLADLPLAARSYIERINKLSGVPVAIVSVGYDRGAHIMLKNPFEAPRGKPRGISGISSP